MAINVNNTNYTNYTNSDSDSYYDSYSDSSVDNDNSNKYELAYCELHNPQFHGGSYDNDEDKMMCGKYLYVDKVRNIFPTNNNAKHILSTNLNVIRNIRRHNGIENIHHPTIRNYRKIICKRDYRNAQIVKKIFGPGLYRSAIIKTHYLRLLQRKWKRLYVEKQCIINLRKKPKVIRMRELTGKWSKL